MKHLERVVRIVAAVAALVAMCVSSASATTLEVEGAKRTESVGFTLTLKSGTSMVTKDTAGFSTSTCTASELKGATVAPFSGSSVTAAVNTLVFGLCARTISVHKGGTLHFTWTSGTNGTMSSSGSQWTMGSPFGTLNCKTNEGTHLGTLTGVASGEAALDINAILSCSGISLKLEATYLVTTPLGLGVTS